MCTPFNNTKWIAIKSDMRYKTIGYMI